MLLDALLPKRLSSCLFAYRAASRSKIAVTMFDWGLHASSARKAPPGRPEWSAEWSSHSFSHLSHASPSSLFISLRELLVC